VVAPDGKIISEAPLFKATVLTEVITPMGGMTPYARSGDKPVIYVLVILLVGLIIYGNYSADADFYNWNTDDTD
jgi:apolipoprotein N-acyltransferase